MRRLFSLCLDPVLEALSHAAGWINFTNELGNDIRLQVQAREIHGRNFKTKEAGKAPGVLIMLEGPTSTSENHITLMEAEQLYRQLGRVLHGKTAT